MDLPFFQKRMALLASDLNKLSNEIRASRITSVVGGSVSVTSGGTMLTVGGGNARVAQYATPFEIIPAEPTTQDGPGTKRKFQVNPNSYLMEDENEEPVYIYGVSDYPANNEPFELPPIPGAIMLKVEFGTDMEILGAWLEYGEIDNTLWPQYPDPIERDILSTGADYLREKYLRVMLAEVVDPVTDEREGPIYEVESNDRRKVIQNVNTDLVLQWTVLDGLAAKLAVPWKRSSRATRTNPTPP